MRRGDAFTRFMGWLFIGYLLFIAGTVVWRLVERPHVKEPCVGCITL